MDYERSTRVLADHSAGFHAQVTYRRHIKWDQGQALARLISEVALGCWCVGRMQQPRKPRLNSSNPTNPQGHPSEGGHPFIAASITPATWRFSEQDSVRGLQMRLKRYTSPQLLVINEVGYLSSNLGAADLLFEVIHRRYEQASTIITTNKPL